MTNHEVDGLPTVACMETTSEDSGLDLWRVQLSTGEIRAMSLDALDEAFQAGTIDESTPVLPPGAMGWTKLADAAGLEGDAPPESNVPSVAPIAVSIREPAPMSLEDLAAEADEEQAFKPKRRKGVIVGIGVAFLLVGGLGVAATRAASKNIAMTTSLVANTAKAAAAQPPPAAQDPNPSTAARTLTDEQKAKLAEADKARAAREEQKRKDRPPPPTRRSPREKSAPFSNGGNKFDPLNGSL